MNSIREVGCAGCQFFQPVDERQGQCRRHAPRVFVMQRINLNNQPEKEIFATFPPVPNNSWCGEGEPLVTVKQ